MKKTFAIVLLVLIVLSLIALAIYTYKKEKQNPKKEIASTIKGSLLVSPKTNVTSIKLS